MRATPYVVVPLSCVALAAAGCSREQDSSAGATDNAPPPSTTAASTTTADGSDASQIKTGKALAKEGSAAATALTLVRDVRDGAGPILLPAYDSRILERVGVSNVIGALESVRQITQLTTPVLVRERRATHGQLVVLRLLRQEGEDRNYAFLLRRQGGRWVVAYDSLLAEGVRAYVQGATAKDPGKPSKSAIKAGERAVSELKLAARNPRADRPRAQEPPTQATTPVAP